MVEVNINHPLLFFSRNTLLDGDRIATRIISQYAEVKTATHFFAELLNRAREFALVKDN
jgi:hypothetical protein